MVTWQRGMSGKSNMTNSVRSSGGGSLLANSLHEKLHTTPSNEEKVMLAAEESKDRLYEPKRDKKMVRVLTVVVYVFSVSLAAIMLSLYYVFFWEPKGPHYIKPKVSPTNFSSTGAAATPLALTAPPPPPPPPSCEPGHLAIKATAAPPSVIPSTQPPLPTSAAEPAVSRTTAAATATATATATAAAISDEPSNSSLDQELKENQTNFIHKKTSKVRS